VAARSYCYPPHHFGRRSLNEGGSVTVLGMNGGVWKTVEVNELEMLK